MPPKAPMFSPSEQKGLFMLALLLALVVIGVRFLRPAEPQEMATTQTGDTLQTDDRRFCQNRTRQFPSKGGQKNARRSWRDEPVETFAFDPNTADSLTLRRLGLAPWVAGNILKYRRAGGRFRQADDLARIYSLREQDFQRLRPHIRIASSPTEDNRYARDLHPQPVDTAGRNVSHKFTELTPVELNAADTTLLMRVPGIGRYWAGRIVRYRERLGGYVRVEQVAEIENLPEGLMPWFRVAPQVSRKLAVNRLSFSQLLAHPYLSYEQVKALTRLIRQSGSIRRLDDLAMLEPFTSDDLERLAPYLSFETGPQPAP